MSPQRKLIWTTWFIGTILIGLSWLDVVDRTTGWIGFGLAAIAAIAAIVSQSRRADSKTEPPDLENFSEDELRRLIAEQTHRLDANASDFKARLLRARANSALHQWEEAVADYRVVIEESSDSNQVLVGHVWIAAAFEELGEYESAAEMASKAIDSSATHSRVSKAFVLRLRASCRLYCGDFSGSLEDCRRFVEIDKPDNHFCIVMGQAHLGVLEYPEALAMFEKAAELAPQDSTALHMVSYVRSTCPDSTLRDGRKAVRLSELACELTHQKDWYCLSGLANAWAECGDFDKAVHFAEHALKLAPAHEQPERQERVDQYRNRTPYRHSHPQQLRHD